MTAGTTSDELTPLAGSPIFVLGNKRQRRAPSRPKSLAPEYDETSVEISKAIGPTERILNASATIGVVTASSLGIAALAVPDLHARGKATLALVGLIYAVFYLTFRSVLRSQGRAPRMQLGVSFAEAILPATMVAVYVSLDVRPPIHIVTALATGSITVCATRLSRPAVLFVGSLATAFFAISLLVWRAIDVDELVAPLVWLAIYTGAAATAVFYANSFLDNLIGKASQATRLEGELRRYLSSEAAEAILDEHETKAERRAVSVLFCDLRGFTFLCERERPEDVVELLNTVYDGTCRIIETHGGSVNKFLGDGLLAIFSKDLGDENHTTHAAKAALEMQQWIRFLRERGGIWTHVAMGIGIDTGDVVAGPIGGTGRREYTVIGTSVNRAARLQAFAERDYQRIVLSHAATHALPPDLPVRALGSVELKGFARAEKIYALHQDPT